MKGVVVDSELDEEYNVQWSWRSGNPVRKEAVLWNQVLLMPSQASVPGEVSCKYAVEGAKDRDSWLVIGHGRPGRCNSWSRETILIFDVGLTVEDADWTSRLPRSHHCIGHWHSQTNMSSPRYDSQPDGIVLRLSLLTILNMAHVCSRA